MNEPKRRGRPPKAQVLEQMVEAITPENMHPTEADPLPDAAVNGEFARRQALAYARRIWAKQSPDLSRHERLGRIAEALKAQGMSMEGIELP